MMAEMLRNAETDTALPALALLIKKCEKRNNAAAVKCIKAMQSFGRIGAEYIIPYLHSESANIRNAAVTALQDISGRNYGNDMKKWQKWIKNH